MRSYSTKLSTFTLTNAAAAWVSKPFSKMVVTELSSNAWSGWRFDVVAITPNAKFIQMIEVKKTRADFLRGKKEGQFERYMPYCHQFFIAAPAGMIDKTELPPGVGLVEIWESGTTRIKKRAARRDIEGDNYRLMVDRMLQKLIIREEVAREEQLIAHWHNRSSFRRWLASTELSRQDIKV